MWCFAQPNQWTPDQIDLDMGELHHAAQVMRVRDGDTVHVFDGVGRVAEGALRMKGRRDGFIEPTQLSTQKQNPLSSITLAPAVCKPARWEWMLEKCAEAGLGTFTPLLTEHCVSRPQERNEAKLEKWRAVFIRACKQSHNAWLPVLSPISSLHDWLSVSRDLNLAGAITPDAQPLGQCLPEHTLASATIGVTIGPEGDFSETEYEQLRTHNVQMLSLGDRTLRCETAALYLLHALQFEIERQHHA